MTKRLEDILNLPGTSEEDTAQVQNFIKENQLTLTEIDDAISKIDIALPTVRDLDTGDGELDELAKLAKDKAEDLIDLGMNVDPRFAGVILQTASQMLGHSITAKTAKLDKKLKMVQLQLAKAKFDHQVKKDAGTPEDQAIEGHGIELDRNELLKQILSKQAK